MASEYAIRAARTPLIRQMRSDWIEAFQTGTLNLPKLPTTIWTRRGGVRRPFGELANLPELPPHQIPEGTHAEALLSEMSRGVLIVGLPGAGKTTFLLKLADDL